MGNEDSSSNSVMAVALVVIVLIVVGAVIWFTNQKAVAPEQPGAVIDVNLPGNPPAPSPSPQSN